MLNIKGLNKAELLVELYNNALLFGLDIEMNIVKLTYDDAFKLLEENSRFDQLYGKILKIDLSGDEFDERLYDRDNGAGKAQSVVVKLREKQTEMDKFVKQINITQSQRRRQLAVNMDYRFFDPEEYYTDEEKKVEQQIKKQYTRIIYLWSDSGVYFVVNQDEKYGAVSTKTGEVIIPCEFNKYSDAVKEWERLGYPISSVGNQRVHVQ